LIGTHRQPLIAFLCLTVLASSTTTSIQHSHDYGRAPHAHGFGLVSVLPVAPVTAEPDAAFAARHSNFVILGIEFYGDDEPLPQAPGSPDDTQLTLGVDDDSCLNDSARSALVLLPFAGRPAPAVVQPLPALAVRLPLTARCILCDRSRGERSGVHLF